MKLFSFGHIIALVTICFVMLLFKFNSEKLRNYKNINLVTLIYGLALLLIDSTYYFNKLGEFDIRVTLPLELCSFGLYTIAFCFILNKKELFKYALPLCLLGSVFALLLPLTKDSWTFLSVRYFHFFLVHGGLFLAVFYAKYVLDYKVSIKDYKKFMRFFTIAYISVYAFNITINGNYMMNVALPGFFSVVSDTLGVFYPLAFYLILSLAYFGIYKLYIRLK